MGFIHGLSELGKVHKEQGDGCGRDSGNGRYAQYLPIDILQTEVIVIKRRVMLFPVVYCEFDEIAPAKLGGGDDVLPPHNKVDLRWSLSARGCVTVE